MKNIKADKYSGKFNFPEKTILGELTLDGKKTSLYLHDENPFHIDFNSDLCIQGQLHDLRKVSLIDCIPLTTSGSFGRHGQHLSYSEIFPNYVILGDEYISSEDKKISSIRFVIEDAAVLFYDFDVFGQETDCEAFVDQIIQSKSKKFKRRIERGQHPSIFYFTGKEEIFSANTALGRISARNEINYRNPGPKGIQVNNTIAACLDFDNVVNFKTAFLRALIISKYFGLLIGRPQDLLDLTLVTKEKNEKSAYFQIYWPHAFEHKHTDDKRPHAHDVLISPISNTENFSTIIANWISRHDQWHDARGRFFGSFQGQEAYDYDRLIACANMFDILPDNDLPQKKEPNEDFAAAINSARKIFLKLPASETRNQALGAIGRLAIHNLKDKIRYRATFIEESIPDKLPELDFVVEQAVNCRNHYVHGSDAKFNYEDNFQTFAFLTDALQFVFAASDLIEAGWDIKNWSKKGTSLSHPFARFRFSYSENLNKLKILCGKQSEWRT